MIAQAGNGKVVPPTPNEIAKAITGRDYLSYSQITTYQACTLKWWYTYVANAPREHVSSALLLGSGIHAAIEHHLLAQMAAEPTPSIDTLMDVFKQTWREDAIGLPIKYSRGETADTQPDTARRMLQAYLASEYALVEGKLIGIEESLRTQLSNDLPHLVGVVDKMELRAGELVISDIKTARCAWGEATATEHAEQLILYGQAAQEIAAQLEASVRLQFVVITKTKTPTAQTIDVHFDRSKIDRSKKTISQVFRSMQLGIVYPNPSAFQCPSCPFVKRCRDWQDEAVV